MTCKNYQSGWYITLNGYTVSNNLGINASYCFSLDGMNCFRDYSPNCDIQSGNDCSK